MWSVKIVKSITGFVGDWSTINNRLSTDEKLENQLSKCSKCQMSIFKAKLTLFLAVRSFFVNDFICLVIRVEMIDCGKVLVDVREHTK